jgi:hypothetical protein
LFGWKAGIEKASTEVVAKNAAAIARFATIIIFGFVSRSDVSIEVPAF